MRKVSRSLSSLRSPRSPRVLAASKRVSTSASEMLSRMTALISWPESLAEAMTASSSPDQRPIEERMRGELASSGF